MNKKKYYEIKIRCAKSVSETISSFLIENGALGTVEENVLVDETHKKTAASQISAYFRTDKEFMAVRAGLKSLLENLKKNFPGFKEYKILQKWLEEKNWREGYKKYFKPVKVSKRIVVMPDYEKYTPAAAEKVITINPQMAFGIGNHPTTKMCIEYIDEILADSSDPAPLTMLDAGTGSGILAIAAALLGVRNIYGFDTDTVAVETAKENITKNGVAEHIRLGCHGIQKIKKKYDIVAANILAEVLISMKKHLVRVTKPGGDMILSGILREQKDEVVKAFTDTHPKGSMTLVGTKKEKDWTTLRFFKSYPD
jgi:ribosomal protein L11 methyltransferase